MEKLIWFIIPIAILAIGFKFLEKRLSSSNDNNAYEKKEFLLNIPERKFYETLQKLLPEEYICFPQMVISNILNVKKAERKEYLKNRSKINKKTIDFVIFKKPYLQPVLAIEYDGSSHNKPSRQKRDAFVNNILKNSNLDIIHIKHKTQNIEEHIKNEVLTKLN